MAYQLRPVSARVAAMRKKYRETKPELCIARYKLITEYYTDPENAKQTGILRRAKCLRHILTNIPIRIDDGEVIVGAQSAKYRAAAMYPENSVNWLKDEIESRFISTREIDPYIISEEDRRYALDTIGFWQPTPPCRTGSSRICETA